LFRVPVRWRQLDARQRLELVVVAATITFSGLVLYSIIHEAGHLLFGRMWGGTPAWDQVSWTIFSGEEPHANFRSLPPESVPWMGAGGVLLPTLVGCALIIVSFQLHGRVTWWVHRVLISAGAILLLGNLGLFADTGHTLPLAIHLGAHGIAAQILALMPAMLTLIIWSYIGYLLRHRGKARERASANALE
jgi:hypothetical protein